MEYQSKYLIFTEMTVCSLLKNNMSSDYISKLLKFGEKIYIIYFQLLIFYICNFLM